MVDRIQKTLALVTSVLCAAICFWSAPSPRGQNRMPESSALSKWRPTHGYSDISYVGSGACARCHTAESATQVATPMGKALAPAADCQILSTHPRLTFRNGSYSYQIVRQANRSIYTVADGVNAISEPLLYCFGVGKVGQTYVFRHNGLFYETHVSYYQETQNLDFTTGHRRTATSPEEALGRPLSVDEAQACFACHATGAVTGSQLQLDHLIPGVSCEACHGPGEKHIAAVKARKFKELQIFNPGKMEADELTQEFCGSCHRSFDQVMVMPGQAGLNNIRFQPYRMFNSRGHKGDLRISCIACHDPHDKLERDAAFYDSKCLACHLTRSGDAKTASRSAPACPVSKQQCAKCHMPKVELPEMHFMFTDHWIRIVRPNDSVPN